MRPSQRAVCLTILMILDLVDAGQLASVIGLSADFGFLSRVLDSSLLELLQWLKWLRWLPGLQPGLDFRTGFDRVASLFRSNAMIDYIEPLTIGLIPTLIVIDWAIRGRKHHSTRFWRVRATLVTVAIFYLAGYAAVFWGTVLGDFHLLDGSGLGTWAGALVAILVYEFGHYWYHRAAHAYDWLWRAGHQMHHSAESLDAFGAYYLHPVDAFIFTTIASLVFYPLLGLTAEAGLVGALFLTFNALFQHMSLRTPRWLGYIVQRPESHSVHHGKNIHRYNYSDLPLWDIVFGTFRNPPSFQKEHGFYAGSSERLAEMLAFRDVTSPKRKRPKQVVRGKAAA
jgi:sterol desaturase/sphingolipid hydroxylase (fatty acid hydroxylase superfamily)